MMFPATSARRTSQQQSSHASSAASLIVKFTWHLTWRIKRWQSTCWPIPAPSSPVTSAKITRSSWRSFARQTRLLFVWSAQRGSTNTMRLSPWRTRAERSGWGKLCWMIYFYLLHWGFILIIIYLCCCIISASQNYLTEFSHSNVLQCSWCCICVRPLQSEMRKTETDFQQMIQARIRKSEEIKASVGLSKVRMFVQL